MAGYRLRIKSSAAKELESVDRKADRRRLIERISALSGDPRSAGAEKLAGHQDRYRIRQGNYRVVYTVDDARREVMVFRIGHRRDVYR